MGLTRSSLWKVTTSGEICVVRETQGIERWVFWVEVCRDESATDYLYAAGGFEGLLGVTRDVRVECETCGAVSSPSDVEIDEGTSSVLPMRRQAKWLTAQWLTDRRVIGNTRPAPMHLALVRRRWRSTQCSSRPDQTPVQVY